MKQRECTIILDAVFRVKDFQARFFPFFSQMLVNTSPYDVFEIPFHTEPLHFFHSLSHFSLTTPTYVKQ